MAIKPTDFALVAVDLLDATVFYGRWLEQRGYRVTTEPYDLEYPNSPVFYAVRGSEHLFCEVSSNVNLARAEEWLKFGKASNRDTRYIVVIANGNSLTSSDLSKLKSMGVGIDVIEGTKVQNLCAAHDLSLNVEFPKLERKLQKCLGRAADLFGQGHWKESFEDACVALETEARNYMIKAIRAGRVSFISEKGKPITLSEAQVAKMPLGSLARAFTELARPTQAESRVAQALTRINPKRVTVAHFKHTGGARERKLRSQVGKDLIVIVNAIRMLKGL